MDITYPLFSAILIYSFLVFANYFREEKLKHYIRLAFKHYLSPFMVDKLIEKRAKLKLGGQRKEMTFMFCDVRDFTSLAEKINPTVLTKLVNRFFTTMSDIILKHGGTIDKYIGDCIMAFWGAPITDQHHCVHACQASLEMETKLKIFKEKIKKDLEVDNKILRNLSIGIGINTGICVVGNFGTRKRFDYSVLGDSVNLASRLEGQTKIYGIAIIFGEKTKDALEKFAVIELDKIRVKGKQTPEKIYTVLGDDAVKQEKDFKSLLKMQAKFLDSYRNRKWNIAIKFLHKAQRIGKKYGLHQYYNVLKERIALFKKKPPLPGWKGIFNVDIK